MVGDNIQDQPNVVILEFGHEALKVLMFADLGIQLVVVRDVVSVRAAFARPENRRRIHMRDTERVQVSYEAARIIKAKARVELQTIRPQRSRAPLVCRQTVEALGDAARLGDQDRRIGSHGKGGEARLYSSISLDAINHPHGAASWLY